MLLFAAMVLSAVLFDAYHQGTGELLAQQNKNADTAQTISASIEYCVNPGSTFRLISGAEKLFSGLVFSGNSNEFLAAFHNQRSFRLLKAESCKQPNSSLLVSHFHKFNCCHQNNSDDNAAATA